MKNGKKWIAFGLAICVLSGSIVIGQSKGKVESEVKGVSQASEMPNKQASKQITAKRTVAYYTSWSGYERNVQVSDINAALLTHINFAFANLNASGEIVVGDRWIDVEKPFGTDNWEGAADSHGHFKQLRILKKKYPKLKTLISVGGWTWSGQFSDVAASAAKRKKFAKSAVSFLKKYGFDGIDIDWEYPVEGGNGIKHRTSDKTNYTKLVKETRAALDKQGKKDGKHYLLTIAAGANSSFIKNTQIKSMMKYLDYINIMTYDYHGGWEQKTGHNAPLYASNGTASVSSTILAYIKAGVKPKDINMGLAFYGRGWENVKTAGSKHGLNQSGTVPNQSGFGRGTYEGGVFDYYDLASNYVNKKGYKRYFDKKAKVPYLYNGSVFISYEDKQSIKAKLDYANLKKLGGVMFWEFSGDKKLQLQKVIADYQK